MERKKTIKMNFDALGEYDDDEEDRFFESRDRLSSAVPLDLLDSSGSDDDDEFYDSRASSASAFSALSTTQFRTSAISNTQFRNYAAAAAGCTADYDIWMAAPGSISQRRKRLFQGMGLSPNRELLPIVSSNNLSRAVSNKMVIADAKVEESYTATEINNEEELSKDQPSSSPVQLVLVRSRSEGDIESLSVDKKRKDEILGLVSKQRLTRTSSMIIVSQARVVCPYQESVRIASPCKDNQQPSGTTPSRGGRRGKALTSMPSNSRFGAFFLIKNLDTGKEFIVNEYDQDGMWNKVSDLQTGKQLTLEEFEKCVGHSPVVKELMSRENVKRMDQDRKMNSYFTKSLRMSKKTGAALIKNIKGVAQSMSISASKGEDLSNGVTNNQDNNSNKEKENPVAPTAGAGGEAKQGWVKVRQTGRSYKELSALHLCQEIQAHQGSIWTMRFSSDGKFLASGGEDKVIHVWEVQECEVMSLNEGNLSAQLSPSLSSSSSVVAAAMTPGIGEVTPLPSEKRKKKKGSKKGSPIPEYVNMPETVFSLSEKPVCSFTGHLDDVLDLSWSRSQLLLSSSMDKTVRLWDLETKSCLKLFAHNDYVTCIQFNPMDDNYFISGSLDAKVRIWKIPDRQLVDWTDLHEMVTAVCFTPDGQGALIGSHKGSCRMYKVEDCKLNQMERIELSNKKKSEAKKITGFHFSPGNPSEVLVSSADSRIRILDGSEVVHKFKGFKNLNSQISASFSLDGKHVICASEDSQVFVWKRDERRAGNGKGRSVVTTGSYESFQCKDVSIAIPWPGTVKGDLPPIQVQSKRQQSKRTSASQAPYATHSASSSPTKEDAAAGSRRHSQQSPSGSPTRDENPPATNNKKQLPPLPKKKNKNMERATTPPEEDPSHIASSEPGVGESFTSSSSSIRNVDSPSMSAAAAPSSSSDGTSHGNNTSTAQATAWGVVIVTATVGGEIRAYQNFGLPRRIGRL